MAHQSIPRMSLVAQFDDLCRYTNVLTSGPEAEFKTFVEGQLNCMRQWKKTEIELVKANEKISNLKTENGRLETKIKHLKDLLKDADSAKRKIESEKNSLARQIAIIKEVLLADGGVDNQTREKLFLLTTCPDYNSPPRMPTIEESAGSLLSLSEIDQTDEDLESRSRRGRKSRGKRSSSETRAAQKKKRLGEEEQYRNRLNEFKNANYADVDQRSNSEPASSSPEFPTIPRQDHRVDSTPFKYNTYDKYDTASLCSNTPLSQYNALKKVGKDHQFVTKTVMNRVKCVACKQNIGYLNKSLKCHSCGIIYHPECVKQCSLICFPIVNTPTKGTAGTVADYTSSSSPMIPPLIVHCIREIESRGFKEIGLYRVSASERDVKNLKEKFVSGRPVPCLSDVDVHALCGVVKEFLRSLKEPLIPRSAWRSFVDAADLKDNTESSYALCGIIMDLPQPNRDTLSFLILHLQKITESPLCKMNVENLARIFGPTVVGYSTADPADANMLKETTYQYQVMKRLLSLPNDFWQNVLSVESENFHGSVKGTPENLPAPKGTRLGPIYASAQKSKSVTLRKATLTPRNSKSNKPMHFASPLLK